MLGMKEEAGNHDFLQKLFCLTVPKLLVGESFSVSLISCLENIGVKRGGGFCVTVPKLFVEEPLCAVVQKISGVGKSLLKEGRGREYQDFPSITFCLKNPLFFVAEIFSISLNSVIEKNFW